MRLELSTQITTAKCELPIISSTLILCGYANPHVFPNDSNESFAKLNIVIERGNHGTKRLQSFIHLITNCIDSCFKNKFKDNIIENGAKTIALETAESLKENLTQSNTTLTFNLPRLSREGFKNPNKFSEISTITKAIITALNQELPKETEILIKEKGRNK
jgi:hypothetical protein